jgi:DNA-binding NarL/FixJ family response regulator
VSRGYTWEKQPKLPTKLIIVDDYEIIRIGLGRLLQAQPDIEVVAEANSEAKAVTLSQNHHPDVILVDVKMSGMNEIEVVHYLKADCPSVAVVALIIQGDENGYFLPLLVAGVSCLIPKQATPDDLFQAIRTVNQGDF